jgi:glutamyl-tRNA synthetase
MPLEAEIEKLTQSTALRNAVEHNGKAQLEAVISKLMASRADLRSSIKTLMPEIKIILDYINSLSPEAQRAKLEESTDKLQSKEQIMPERSGTQPSPLPPLRNAIRGKVITRFPPEPNGYPHIGHAKAAIIDEEYARMYDGKLILRFDDTNPLKEKIEYYNAIKDGLDWLGVKPDQVKNTSDDISFLHELGKKLVLAGGAYVCTCTSGVIHDLRAKGIDCECRKERSTADERIEKMFNGNYDQNGATIRFKGNMADQNTAMRDPTLFRIIDGKHPLLGDSVRVWPTYDFAAPIEDSIDGVTHAMRTKEYELRNELYFAILDRLSMRKPEMLEFSRLEFEGLPVSKRKLKPLVEDHLVSGWDDPRLPTLEAFRRRGFKPEAIRRFVLSLGITLAETKPPFETLESFNRKLIDPVSPRLFFVQDPVMLQIDGLSNIQKITLKNHPTNSSLGVRQVLPSHTIFIHRADANRFKVGANIRLIEFCNVTINNVDPVTGNAIATLSEIQDIGPTVQKIQWVAKNDIVDFRVFMPKSLYVGEQFNSESLQIASGYAESYVSKLDVGSMIQFVRFGFCRLDGNNTAIMAHK